MPWSGEKNGGFTTGTPWIGANPNYPRVNAEAELADPDSVFNYYKKLIALRHANPIIVYGTFHPLMEDSDVIYAYDRRLDGKTLRVLCNFSDRIQLCALADTKPKNLLISNYRAKTVGLLRPYEAQAFFVE